MEGSKMKHVDPRLKELIEEFLKNLKAMERSSGAPHLEDRAKSTVSGGSSSSPTAATRGVGVEGRAGGYRYDFTSDPEAMEVLSGWYDEPQPKDVCGHSVSRETCTKPECEWKRNQCRRAPEWLEKTPPKDTCGHFVNQLSCKDPCEWRKNRCRPQAKATRPEEKAIQGRPLKPPNRVTSAVLAALALAGNVLPSQQGRSLVPLGMYGEHRWQPQIEWWHSPPPPYHGTLAGELH
jgi:hypothetical protein